jgi:hypothetical protein
MDEQKKGQRSVIRSARVTVTEDGEAMYSGDPEAVAEAKEARGRTLAREERRKELWGEIGPGSMTRLARLFPSLRDADGVEPWDDALKLLRWACSGKSHGEVLAAKFVLSVWNSSTDWGEMAREEGIITSPEQHFSRFDVFEAMATWDAEHVEAMLTWLRLPFWP